MNYVTAITEPGGMGPILSAVAVAYNAPLAGGEKSLAALSVVGRNVTRRYLHSAPEKAAHPDGGKFVILELDPRDRAPMLREMVGQPPHSRAAYPTPKAVVCQEFDLTDVNGTCYPAGQKETTEVNRTVVVDFSVQTFVDPASSNELNYCLFTPKTIEEGKKYPLVTFIHDAGACSDDVRTGLLQGVGGTVWAADELQKEHPCFVLVPQYSCPIVDDDWNTTWEVEATNALIDAVAAAHPVDTGRLYLTGQSMGCMTSCRLMAMHPRKWAGAYLVAGQWEPTQMADVTDTPVWYLVSDKDEKAFPGMNAIAAIWEEQGIRITRGAFDVLDSPSAVNEAAKKLAESDEKVFCTTLTGDGIIPSGMPRFPGVHHVCTWLHAYNIPAIRCWLFEQHRDPN